MADAPPRQTTRAPHSSSHSHQGRADSFVARRGRSSSRARPYRHSTSSDDTTALARHRALAHQWSWMQLTLATWRMEDNIEIPTGIEEIPPMDLSPYTQEPTHFTVPVLAARMHRHERQLRDMDRELQETRRLWRLTAMERINQVSEEHENTVTNMDILRNQLLETGNEVTQTMGTVQGQLTSSQNEISILQWRLRETETRLFEAIGNVQALEGQLREAIGMIGRLTANMERVVTLLPPPSQPPNPQQD